MKRRSSGLAAFMANFVFLSQVLREGRNYSMRPRFHDPLPPLMDANSVKGFDSPILVRRPSSRDRRSIES